MSYKIGSFNLCNLSFQSDNEIRKSFENIANIIREENYDIVALQEIISEEALKLLLRYLGAYWKKSFDVPDSYSSDRRGEGYAYIWNSRRIDLVHTEDYGQIKSIYPRVWKQYPKTYGTMIREPYYARFTPSGLPGGSFFEIRLINTHLIFKNVSDRQKEFNILVNNIYDNISNRVYGNNMPAYTIILGDYNLNLCREHTQNPYVAESVYIDSGRLSKTIITVQDQLTTIKKPVVDEYGNKVCNGYANNYDHFSYDQNYNNIITLNSGRVDAVGKYYGNDFLKYRREISDHVPISLDFDLFV